jgi:hypothetical protein
MSEYDQFMRQVKSKAPKEGFANEFGSTASMKAALGYDPNSNFDPTNRQSPPPKRSLNEMHRKIMQIGDKKKREEAYNKIYMPAFERETLAITASSKRQQEAEALRRQYANMGFDPDEIETMVARFMQEKRAALSSGPLYNPSQQTLSASR